MEKVIFEKKGKVISTPWSIVQLCSKIRGLYSRGYDDYVTFDRDVDRVRFYQCTIEEKLKFKQLDNQKIEFVECNFTSHPGIVLCGGSLDVYNSFLDDAEIVAFNCQNVSLLLNKEDTKLRKLSVSAFSTCISGNIKHYYYDDAEVVSDFISAHDLKMNSECGISFSAPHLRMENCSFEYRTGLYIGYNNLNMNQVEFLSDHGDLNFGNITSGNFSDGFKYDTIMTYTSPIVLTDSDILNEKNQAINSLFSVPKGYGVKNSSMNDRDIKEITSKIDSKYEQKINQIEQEQKRLQKQKEKLLQKENISKERAEEGLANRKIKKLTYPKE